MITLASSLARALGAFLADTLAPPTCAACSERLPRRAVFCPPCAASVLPAAAPRPLTFPLVAFASFGGPVAAALRRLKYEEHPELAGPLGDLLRHAARREGLRGDLIVPVPLHPARLAERGYNQAALLAAAAARELGAPLEPRALRRTRDTARQARLDRAGRLENVAGAFVAGARAGRVRGRRVVLVDDVATTGSTLAACSDALREAGASSVTALVVARAEQP